MSIAIAGTPAYTAQISFGLSIGSTAAGVLTANMNAVESNCFSDYLEVPGGVAAMASAGAHTNTVYERLCGRYFAAATAATASATVCSMY